MCTASQNTLIQSAHETYIVEVDHPAEAAVLEVADWDIVAKADCKEVAVQTEYPAQKRFLQRMHGHLTSLHVCTYKSMPIV